MRLTIIGAGNLGSSIAKGIVSKDIFAEICVTRRNTQSVKYLKDKGIKVLSDNKEAARNSDVILLAVKPHQVKLLLKKLQTKWVMP
jgi:pyrroline-5-carboxylate reductase